MAVDRFGRQILVKPRFDGGGGGGLLVDSGGTYTIRDPQGNVLDTLNANDRNRGKEGIKLSSSAVQQGLPQGSTIEHAGTSYTLSGNVGDRHEFDRGRSDPTDTGGKGSLGGGGQQASFDANGNVILSTVDFSSLEAPFVNFGSAFDFAEGIGDENRETYFRNINDPRTKQTALDLIDTDIEGIKRAGDALGPYNRAQGRLDTQENIARSGEIDQYNFSRIPRFNDFNRGQVRTNNQFNRGEVSLNNAFARDETDVNNVFNRAEREESIGASGLDYRKRITKVLDDLAVESTGRFHDDLLDTLMTTTARDRGADIGSSSGIIGSSGAGTRVQDLIDVGSRVQMAREAELAIPNILTQGQSILQPPEERAGTERPRTEAAPLVFNAPTNVPLNPSNVADRIPVQSSLSAGNTQLGLGTNATNLEVIPATTALTTRLDTDRFNETGQYNRDALVLGATQAQLTAQDSQTQTGINQTRADAAGAAGAAQGDASANAQGFLNTIGGLISGVGSIPVGGGQTAGGAVMDWIGGQIQSVIGGGGGGTGAGAGAGGGGGPLVLNDTQSVPPGGTPSLYGYDTEDTTPIVGSGGGGGGYPLDTNLDYGGGGGGYGGGGSVGGDFGGGGGGSGDYTLDGGFSTNTDIAKVFRDTATPVSDGPTDSRLAREATSVLSGPTSANSTEQAQSAASITTESLKSKGMLSPKSAQSVSTIIGGLTTIANPNSTDAQRAAAVASAIAASGGEATAPGTAAGNGVSALQAYSVLSNPNASVEQKTSALAAIGIRGAAANELISNTAGGAGLAALSVFNTAANWNEMDPLHQAASVLQTSNAVFSAFSNAAATSSTAGAAATAAPATPQLVSATFGESAGTTGLGTAGAVIGGAAAVVGIGLGIKQEADVIDAANDMPQSQSMSFAIQGSAAAGAAIGAGVGAGAVAVGAYTGATVGSYVPVVGTVIGAAVGALAGVAISMTGTKKDSGQIIRDGWRKGLKESGIVEVQNGAYNVTLADGSKYDIGKDGGAKIKNKDGSERQTFDVDWNNPVAVNAIPDAHLFAIATGMDPTSNEKFDGFHRVVSQSINAATSNDSTAEGVRNNFRSMMKDKIDPRDLGMRLEMLRVGNSITDQEYGVYLDRVNQMYGTKLTPTDRQKATQSIVQRMQGQKLDKSSQAYLESITDPKKIAAAQKALEKRIAKDGKASGAAPTQAPVTTQPPAQGRPRDQFGMGSPTGTQPKPSLFDNLTNAVAAQVNGVTDSSFSNPIGTVPPGTNVGQVGDFFRGTNSANQPRTIKSGTEGYAQGPWVTPINTVLGAFGQGPMLAEGYEPDTDFFGNTGGRPPRKKIPGVIMN